MAKVTFLDNHDTQREEAQITNNNGDFYQLANTSLQTNVTELLADPSNLAPSVVHDTATALFARLPPQHHRPMSGKGGGVSCLSRHDAQCAGAETELLLTVSAHIDLISRVVGVKTKSYVSWLSVTWRV